MKALLLNISLALFFCFMISAEAQATEMKKNPSIRLSLCLKKALTLSNPYLRDEARKSCLDKNKNILDEKTCFKISEGFEYSRNEDESKFFCYGEFLHKMNFKSCMSVANTMETIESAEDARWMCFEKFHATLSKNDCLKYSQKMFFIQNRRKIQSTCY